VANHAALLSDSGSQQGGETCSAELIKMVTPSPWTSEHGRQHSFVSFFVLDCPEDPAPISSSAWLQQTHVHTNGTCEMTPQQTVSSATPSFACSQDCTPGLTCSSPAVPESHRYTMAHMTQACTTLRRTRQGMQDSSAFPARVCTSSAGLFLHS